MSSNVMMTLFLDGVRQTDGLCSFSRKVLFTDAGAFIKNALENTPLENVAHTAKQTLFASEKQALEAAQLPEDAEHILVMAVAMPELTRADFSKIAALHLAIGQDVTVFANSTVAHYENAVIRDENDAVCKIGTGNGHKALPAAIFKKSALEKVIGKAENLFDAINLLASDGAAVEVCNVDDVTVLTDGIKAYEAQKKLVMKINFGYIAKGVQIFSPENTFISPDAQIEAGAVILPNCLIKQGCKIGANATIGPNTVLEKAEIGAGTNVNNSQFSESSIGENATVGPFAYVRPNCKIGDKTRIGDFVELKKATIGNGTKVSHLTYIGDAEVGERVNFGCGTVIVNYDGYTKSKTVIGDDCFIGCNTNLIAPVTLGDRVFTAAGTTVTKNVPDGALTVARSRQTNLEGWNDRRRERMAAEKK